MRETRTVEEQALDRVSAWLVAFNAVRAELSPPALRAMLDLTVADSVTSINLGIAMARITYSNDRAAAVVAGMITQSGITRPTLDVIEGGEA